MNFLNAELVKPGIRRRGEEGEKFCPFSRQDWKRGSAGMLSVLIKTMMHKTQCCRSRRCTQRAGLPQVRGFFWTAAGKGSKAEGRAALSTCEVRPGDIKAQEIIHSAEGSSAAQQRRAAAAFYAARFLHRKIGKPTSNVFHFSCFSSSIKDGGETLQR